MKKAALVLVAVFALAACEKQAGSSAAQSSSSASAPTAPENTPVEFEVRDFSLDHEKGEYSTTYKGRGTLVTKDPRLASGNYMVWISVKQSHQNDEPWRAQIFLKDGLGTIETYDYRSNSDKEKEVRYHAWEVLGYIPLEKAAMRAVQEPKPAAEG